MYLVRGADGAFGAIHAGGICGADYMRQRLGAATRDFIERYMQGRYLGITCGAGIWAGHLDAACVRLLPWAGYGVCHDVAIYDGCVYVYGMYGVYGCRIDMVYKGWIYGLDIRVGYMDWICRLDI